MKAIVTSWLNVGGGVAMLSGINNGLLSSPARHVPAALRPGLRPVRINCSLVPTQPRCY